MPQRFSVPCYCRIWPFRRVKRCKRYKRGKTVKDINGAKRYTALTPLTPLLHRYTTLHTVIHRLHRYYRFKRPESTFYRSVHRFYRSVYTTPYTYPCTPPPVYTPVYTPVHAAPVMLVHLADGHALRHVHIPGSERCYQSLPRSGFSAESSQNSVRNGARLSKTTSLCQANGFYCVLYKIKSRHQKVDSGLSVAYLLFSPGAALTVF